MRRLLLILCVLYPLPALAQNECVPTTETTAVTFGSSRVTFVSPDHNTLDPLGQPLIADYLLEAMQGTAVLGSVSLAKTSFASAGPVADCVATTLPTINGLVANTVYSLFASSRTTAGAVGVRSPLGSFFLSVAPRNLGSGRLLAVLRLLNPFQVGASATAEMRWLPADGRLKR